MKCGNFLCNFNDNNNDSCRGAFGDSGDFEKCGIKSLFDRYEIKIKPTTKQWSKVSEVKGWLDRMGVKDYTINAATGFVDVDGDVDLKNKNITTIPVKFINVAGYFDCTGNNLVDLNGCPNAVGKWFSCSSNKLKSFEGGPYKVGSSYYCYNNELKNFKGIAQIMGGDISCHGNPFESLEGLDPGYVEFLSGVPESILEVSRTNQIEKLEKELLDYKAKFNKLSDYIRSL